MSDLNLKAQIQQLSRLQEFDSRIYTLKREKEEKPQEIKALEMSFEQKKQSLSVLEKKLLDLQKLRKDRELDEASKQENSRKLQGQLYSLKTNREYQAMLQQIEDAKADISMMEDKILEALDQIDQVKAEADQEKLKLKEEEKTFLSLKNAINDRIKEIDGLLAQQEALRTQILPAIDPKLLVQYERILQNRDGLAIVAVTHESCQGCNLTTPPQVVNLIKMYEHIVVCESCNRMLYVEE